jgi:hypothetical protein
MHIRTQIRKEAGRRLETLGIWVYDSRVDSLSQRELPGIIISTPSESRDPWLNASSTYTVTLIVDIRVASSDYTASQLDFYSMMAEKALSGFPVAAILGRTDIDIIGAGEVPVGVCSMNYTITIPGVSQPDDKII